MFAAERSCDRAAVRGVDVYRRRQRRPLDVGVGRRRRKGRRGQDADDERRRLAPVPISQASVDLVRLS